MTIENKEEKKDNSPPTNDGDLRVVGLYGELNEEKAENVVYSLIALHSSGKKEVAVLTDEQEKQIEEAEKEGTLDELTLTDVEYRTDYLPMELVISTHGGNASDMFSIYDTMRSVREDCQIKTFGLGKVMSAGVLILAAGTKGERKIGKHCRVMIHGVRAGSQGNTHEIENEVEEIKFTQEQYKKCMIEETKMTAEQLEEMINRKVNVYLSAEEAVEYGIADIIV